MRLLRPLLCISLLVAPLAALDREAFTFTHYDLRVTVDSASGSLAVEGSLMMRNDSPQPQQHAVLQISSSLEWTSIRVGGKPVAYVSQFYVSDLDHTGGLTQAVVDLPTPILPGGSVEVEIAYRGTVSQDASRLTDLGMPKEGALRIEWDRISAEFTAVRGVGYVTWYPISAEAASLADAQELFQILENWKLRHAASSMDLLLCAKEEDWTAVANGGPPERDAESTEATRCVERRFRPLGLRVPTLAAANYRRLAWPTMSVYHLPGQQAAARDYASIAAGLLATVAEWLGPVRQRLLIVEMADRDLAPFQAGSMLLTPLRTVARDSLEVLLAPPLAHSAFVSNRAWMQEGAGHFLQAVVREQQAGRAAALEFMGRQLPALAQAERAQPQSLVTATDQVFYRTKAMYVLWMLRDLVGDESLQRAVKAYRAEEDREPSYFQGVLQKESGKDLEWFFDDWVYRDRGLPDFRVKSVYPRKTLAGTYVVTVAVENMGKAAAEVPLILHAPGGEIRERVRVPAAGEGVARIQMPQPPTEVVVNDGSVPEAETGNNRFVVEAEGGGS